jgi:hypothetical protein
MEMTPEKRIEELKKKVERIVESREKIICSLQKKVELLEELCISLLESHVLFSELILKLYREISDEKK